MHASFWHCSSQHEITTMFAGATSQVQMFQLPSVSCISSTTCLHRLYSVVCSSAHLSPTRSTINLVIGRPSHFFKLCHLEQLSTKWFFTLHSKLIWVAGVSAAARACRNWPWFAYEGSCKEHNLWQDRYHFAHEAGTLDNDSCISQVVAIIARPSLSIQRQHAPSNMQIYRDDSVTLVQAFRASSKLAQSMLWKQGLPFILQRVVGLGQSIISETSYRVRTAQRRLLLNTSENTGWSGS